MNKTPTRTSTTFVFLPLELRQQIYHHALSHLTLLPTSPLSDPTTKLHPSLSLLLTCHQIHAEALPIFTSTATLHLKHRSHHLLLTQSAHRVPELSEVTRLRLGPALLDVYDPLTLNSACYALTHLTIAPLVVLIPHDALVRLDARRELFNPISRSHSHSHSHPGPSAEAEAEVEDAVSDAQLDLITRLVARLEHEVADKVMRVLDVGREKGWHVKVGFEVGCVSEGREIVRGEEGSRHFCGVGWRAGVGGDGLEDGVGGDEGGEGEGGRRRRRKAVLEVSWEMVGRQGRV